MTDQHVVLIVDDDPFIRKLILTTLEGVSSFDLHEAGDGEEAVQVARREGPRLVFLDIDMPRMDGIEACRQMRSQPSMRGSKIVMLTASADDSGVIVVWDVDPRTGIWSQRETLQGHSGRVVALAVTPDGTRLLTSSNDRTAVVWDMTDRAGLGTTVPGLGNRWMSNRPAVRPGMSEPNSVSTPSTSLMPSLASRPRRKNSPTPSASPPAP